MSAKKEKYKSKAAKMKHEKMEYGSKSKMMSKKMGKKK